MLTLEQLILILVWAILAFVIQPHYLMLRISAKYKDKAWVDEHLAIAHATLSERLQGGIGPVFNKALSNHLKTFKASIMQPVYADAKRLNGEIEGEVEGYIEDQIHLPPSVANEAMQRVMKKYPTLSLFLPVLQNRGNSGDQNPPRGGYLSQGTGGRGDF